MMRLATAILLAQLLVNGVLAASSVTLHGVTDTLSPEHEKYAHALFTAAEAFKETEALFDDEFFITKRGWEEETSTDEGDIVYSKYTKHGKMVTVSTPLDVDVDFAMKEAWTNINTLSEWNPNVESSSLIASLTNYTSIVTYASSKALIVSGRDFILTRLYRRLPDGSYRMGTRSVEVDEKPEAENKVRGHIYLGAVQFRAHPEYPETRTICDVVMLVDLKGFLPKWIVNRVLPKIMVMDTEENVKHFKELGRMRRGE
ncbi:hypothetical protein PMAYCL1PPCAC_15171 [Pristionchus mayeri]|uniref:START domain-containing protein n=1 Tax=Pristionchus mayeri TaxID=1317129 RepID=A0AAN5CID9_9BILA|nr:hypothetical protein PMAYCL1PPCAC_15171 [Pristionchus mayeri]